MRTKHAADRVLDKVHLRSNGNFDSRHSDAQDLDPLNGKLASYVYDRLAHDL